MKSQSLPIRTIALIIIALVFFVIAIMYFFGVFGMGKNSSSGLLNISSNKTSETRCLASKFGGCPSDAPYCDISTGDCKDNCDNDPYNLVCEADKTCVDDCSKCSDHPTEDNGKCVT